MRREELRRLARLGAEARLRELEREIVTIHATFPDLRSPRAVPPSNPYTAGVRAAVAGVPSAIAGAVTRRRPKLSAAARKRIAEAQKKRWAEWRAKNGTGAKEAPKKSATQAPKAKASGRSRKKR